MPTTARIPTTSRRNVNIIMEHKEKIFPVTLILLSLAAAVMYYCCGDVKKGVYWTAAAILNVCVTF